MVWVENSSELIEWRIGIVFLRFENERSPRIEYFEGNISFVSQEIGTVQNWRPWQECNLARQGLQFGLIPTRVAFFYASNRNNK